MKIQKMISIDIELMEKLKEENASKLINDMLLAYFKAKEPLTTEQKKMRIAELEAKLEYAKKLEVIHGKSAN